MTNAAENLVALEPALEAFAVHEQFCRVALDAYVVVDSSGRVLKSNSHFAKLTRVKPRLLSKVASLDDIIGFQIDNRQVSIQEILRYRTPNHFEHTVGTLPQSQETVHLVLGVYPFLQKDKAIGAFILLRDITAETNLQGKYEDKATQSITDKLSGLFNRGYFDQYLPDYLAKVEHLPLTATERIVSLIILDIDHFKKCNDTHGHPAGDFVIAEVAGVLRRSFRKNDIICRYGGEEFVCVLPESSLADALAVAESIRMRIENHHFDYQGTTIPVTVSLGVTEIVVGIETGKEALSRADAALYESKKSGRNRSTVRRRT